MYYGAVGASISIAICSLMSVETHRLERQESMTWKSIANLHRIPNTLKGDAVIEV